MDVVFWWVNIHKLDRHRSWASNSDFALARTGGDATVVGEVGRAHVHPQEGPLPAAVASEAGDEELGMQALISAAARDHRPLRLELGRRPVQRRLHLLVGVLDIAPSAGLAWSIVEKQQRRELDGTWQAAEALQAPQEV